MNKRRQVLITGASSGFGLLTAKTLMQNGHTVLATMRNPTGKNAQAADQLHRFSSETSGGLHVLALDVTNEASVNTAVRQALDITQGIDVVVNNAGYAVSGFLETVTEAQLQQQFEVNLFGAQRVIRAVLPGMRKQGKGLIINISSIMGRIIIPFAGAYTASKWALEGLSESYRYELSGTGVDVVVVEPGGFATNFMTNIENGADTERLAHYGKLADMPEKFWGGIRDSYSVDGAPNPQEVADAVATLIRTPHGQRPFRTVVDPLMGGEAPRTLNQTSDQLQSEIFEGIGMKDWLSVKD